MVVLNHCAASRIPITPVILIYLKNNLSKTIAWAILCFDFRKVQPCLQLNHGQNLWYSPNNNPF